MKIFPVRGSDGAPANGGVVSPACRSRQISTCFTPMLSSVQPVTGTDPASTVPSPAGVSKLPNGGDAAALLVTRVKVTLIGPTVLLAPLSASATAPVTV